MSLSSLLIVTARHDTRWVALPIFTTRAFFHTGILVRTGANIERPADLRGKRVGVPEYQMTAALWARGVLQHEFDVMPADIEWYMERTEELSHGGATGFQPPPGIHCNHLSSEKSIASCLLAGELDASLFYIADTTLVDRSRVDLRNDTRVRSLFPDPVAEGARYYQKTGIFPINHCVVMRRSLYERHPWMVLNLHSAFVAAKERVATQTRELVDVYFRMGLLASEARAVFTTDPFPYGLKRNRHTLETLVRYSCEQGLTPRVVTLEEIFAPNTLDL
jgi:4,5-dihydroxyphthalate decarboxylase